MYILEVMFRIPSVKYQSRVHFRLSGENNNPHLNAPSWENVIEIFETKLKYVCQAFDHFQHKTIEHCYIILHLNILIGNRNSETWFSSAFNITHFGDYLYPCLKDAWNTFLSQIKILLLLPHLAFIC